MIVADKLSPQTMQVVIGAEKPLVLGPRASALSQVTPSVFFNQSSTQLMDFVTYKSLVDKIGAGKILQDARYVHESAFIAVPPQLLQFIDQQRAELGSPHVTFNVLKFYHRDFKISLLNYPRFFEDSYPAIQLSCTLDILRRRFRITDYSSSNNPPILHRKETFLLPTDPRVSALSEITAEAERAGLYETPNRIGFRQSWERAICRKGYELIEGRLVRNNGKHHFLPKSSTPSIVVERHRTAIDRNKLSQPMQLIARHGYLDGGFSVLDYGCGKGDDARQLEAHGVDIVAWDPVHHPKGSVREADIVNLGYVINVIEDREERKKTLLSAYGYAKRILVVSAMLGGDSLVSQFRPFGDGVLTSRNTFQKYYTQSELRNYIESTLDQGAVALSPGVFMVFRDKLEEQRFLSERQHIHRDWRSLYTRPRRPETTTISRALVERHKDLFDHFWDATLDLGRMPTIEEFELSEELRSVAGSHLKAHVALKDYYGEDVFSQASESRKSDLLVYFALGLFGKRTVYSKMPEGLRRDVKTFFGGYRDAINSARELLFSVANPDIIESAAAIAVEKLQCGQLNKGHSLVIHRSLLSDLPDVLRIYVGCAAQLYGDIEKIDLIKIHTRSGKVTFMKYDDFEGKPVPELIERIKVKLREQDIDVFDYSGRYLPQPLCFKSRYIPPSFPRYAEQIAFDRRISTLNLVNTGDFGPTREEFAAALRQAKLIVRDFQLQTDD